MPDASGWAFVDTPPPAPAPGGNWSFADEPTPAPVQSRAEMEANAPGVSKLSTLPQESATNRVLGTIGSVSSAGPEVPVGKRDREVAPFGPGSYVPVPSANANVSLYHPVEGALQIAQGVTQLARNYSPTEPYLNNPEEAAAGAHKIVSGAFEELTPLVGEAAALAPAKTALILATGVAAQKGTTAALQKLGVAPEYADLAGDVASIVAGYGAHWTLAPPEVRALVDAAKTPGEHADPNQNASIIEKLSRMATQYEQSPMESRLARELLRRKYNVDIPEPPKPAAPQAETTPATTETNAAPSETTPPATAQTETPSETTNPVGETPAQFEKRLIKPEDVQPGVAFQDSKGRTFTVESFNKSGQVKYTKPDGTSAVANTAQMFANRMKAIGVQAPTATPPAAQEAQQEPVPEVQTPPVAVAPVEPLPPVPETAQGAGNALHVDKLEEAAGVPAAAPEPVPVAEPEPVAAPEEVKPAEQPASEEVVQPKAEPQVEETPEPHKFSSTQVNLPPPLHEAFYKATGKIPDSVLSEEGRETEPHVTALYGLHAEEPSAVREVLTSEGPITAKIGKVSIFKGDDQDVVKLDVESPDLHRVNAALKELPNSNSHPVYQPHVTLAYVKPGEGEKYVGKSIPGLTGKTVTFNALTFSAKDRTKTEIPLEGKQASTPAEKASTPVEAKAKTEPLPDADYAEAETSLAKAENELQTARKEYERLKALHAKVEGSTNREASAMDLEEFSKLPPSRIEEEIRKNLILAGRKYDAARDAHEKAQEAASQINPLLARQTEKTVQNAEVPTDEEADANLKASTEEVSDELKRIKRIEDDGGDFDPREHVKDLKYPLKSLDDDIRDLEHAGPDVMATAKEMAGAARAFIAHAESYTPPKEPSADEHDRLHALLQRVIKAPDYVLDTPAGRALREQAHDLQQEVEFHKPAAIARAQEQLDRENAAKKRAEEKAAAEKKPEPPAYVPPPVAEKPAPKAAPVTSAETSAAAAPEAQPGPYNTLAQKPVSVTIPNKLAKEIVPVLKKVMGVKSNIPILNNVAIVTQKGKTKVFATDLEQAIVFTLSGKSETGDGAVTLPLTALENALKSKSKEDLNISAVPGTVESQSGKATLSVGGAESSASTMSISQFPEVPTAKDVVGSVKAQPFLDAIKKVISAISPEASRFTLNGALVQFKEGKGKLVATDGHRMSIQEFDAPGVKGDAQSYLIPRKALETIQKLFAKDSGNISLKRQAPEVKEGEARPQRSQYLSFGNPDGSIVLISRQLDGQFPDYQRVVPDLATYTHTAIVEREPLLELMKRAVAMKERSNNINLSFRPNQVIGMKKAEDSTVKGNAPAEVTGGGNPRAAMNAKYLADFLSSTAADKVEIHLKEGSNSDPMVMRPIRDASHTTIVMPMREGNVDWDDGLPPVEKPAAGATEEEPAKLGPESGQAPALADLVGFLDKLTKSKAPEGEEVEGQRHQGSGKNFLKRLLLPGRNLAEVRAASKDLYGKAVTAGSARATASAIMQNAIPQIREELEKSGTGITVNDLFSAYQESRLRAYQERYARWGDAALSMNDAQTEEQFQKAFANGQSGLLELMDALSGKGSFEDPAQEITALASRGDWEGVRAVASDVFYDAAEYIAHTMDDDRFREIADAIRDNPAVKAADKLYEDLVERNIGEAHAEHEGVFAFDLGPLGRYYPLLVNDIEGEGGKRTGVPAGRDVPYKKPSNPHNQMAFGISKRGYTTDLSKFAQDLAARLRASGVAGLLKELPESGWAAAMPEDWNGTFLGPDGITYTGVRKVVSPRRTIIKDGTTIPKGSSYIVMPEFVADALEPILEKSATSPEDLTRLAKSLQNVATVGPWELWNHATGVMGAVYGNTPFAQGNNVIQRAMGLPILKYFDIRRKMFLPPLVNKLSGHTIIQDPLDPSTPENARKLIQISQAGALPARSGSVTYSKAVAEQLGITHQRFSFAPLLYGPNGIDARARILMYDMFMASGLPKTNENLGDFINQIGNYTPEFQGILERFVKRIGVGPFSTAGMTRLMNGWHAALGIGPVPAKGSMGWRIAKALAGGVFGSLALYVLAYKELTGKWPNQDPRFKMWSIPVGGGNGPIDQFRHTAIGDLRWGKGNSVGYWNFGTLVAPLISRVTPKLAINRAMHGASLEQILDGFASDATNELAHPVMGPFTKAAFVGATGVEPSITGYLSQEGKVAPQFFPALPPRIKPGFIGGLFPALEPHEMPSKHPGFGARTGARLAASAREMSQLGQLGEGIGMLGGNTEADQKGNMLFHAATDLALPGWFGNAGNPSQSNHYLQRQRQSLAQH